MKTFQASKLNAIAYVLMATAFLILSAGASQAGDRRVEVGVLTCNIHAGTNFIIGSTKTLNCDLIGQSGKFIGTYRGKIRRYGIDLGEAKGTIMSWTVIAPTTNFKRSSLNGRYAGVSADVSLGIGGGAKVLVGGSRKTITLQPLSLQAQRGVNLALAVAGMTLSSDY